MFTNNKSNGTDNSINIDINKNIFSQNCLSPLIVGYPYLPFTDSSIDYHSLHILINDIIVNNRQSIIEFGSGISTILIGRLCKLNNLKTQLYTIDDNEGWVSLMKGMIKKENLENFISLIYAPLEEISLSNHHLKWYSTKILDQSLSNQTFDMVITDGPMAYLQEIERSRFPAVPYIKDKLESNHSIFLHDTNRHGEQSIIEDWSKLLNKENIRYTTKLTGFIEGTSYTISI